MMRVSLCLTALFCTIAAVSSSPAPPSAAAHYCNPSPPALPPLAAGLTLAQAQVLIRHGDRTVASAQTCWNDDTAVWDCKLTQLQRSSVDSDTTEQLGRVFRQQYIPNEEFFAGNCGVGQLTSIGYNQQHMNGQHLRAAYVEGAKLLPETAEEALAFMHLRSDDSLRTIESGQALFDGMYPANESKPTSQLVVPWNIRDEAVDDIGPNAFNCPAMTEALNAIGKSPVVAKKFEGLAGFIQRVAKVIGGTPSLGQLLHWFDCVHAHMCHDKAIPDVFDVPTFNNLTYWATEVQRETMNFNSSRYAKLGMGPLIKTVYDNMVDIKTSSDGALPFYLFSGHDLGPMLPWLAAFDLFTDSTKWCPYAGLIAMELYHDDSSNYFVRMIYEGQIQKIPACGGVELCPWESFVQVINGIVPTAAECQDTSSSPIFSAASFTDLAGRWF